MAQVISVIFFILAVVALLWNIIGDLPGVILFILALTTKDREQKKKYFKWMKICFGGIVMLIAIFVVYFIFNFASYLLLGVSISPPINQLPK